MLIAKRSCDDGTFAKGNHFILGDLYNIDAVFMLNLILFLLIERVHGIAFLISTRTWYSLFNFNAYMGGEFLASQRLI